MFLGIALCEFKEDDSLTEGARDNMEFRKRRRKRIKTIIVALFLLMFVFPIVLSIVLLFRMNRLERQVETLVSRKEEKTHYSTEVPDVVKAEEKEEIVSPAAVEEKQPQKVYLTFNDGPSEQTKEVLDILKKKNVKATFFVIGREDEFSKKMYQRIVKEGHTLGMHSYSHIYKEIYGSFKKFQRDFSKISDLLFDVTGVRAAYYRFPGGSTGTGQLSIEECRGFLEQQGVTYLDWNVVAANGTDEEISRSEMVRSVMDGASMYSTSVVLLYDSADKKMTARSLGAMIDNLRAEGYELLPIDANTTPVQHS